MTTILCPCGISFPRQGRKKYHSDACRKDHWQKVKRAKQHEVMNARRSKRRNQRLSRVNQYKAFGIRGYTGPEHGGVPRLSMLDLPQVTEVEVAEFSALEKVSAQTHAEEREAARKKATEDKKLKAKSAKLNQRIVARDQALRDKQEKIRLSRMTPQQIEREKLDSAERRRAATAEYFAEQKRRAAAFPN